MDQPRAPRFASGMLDNLKSRFVDRGRQDAVSQEAEFEDDASYAYYADEDAFYAEGYESYAPGADGTAALVTSSEARMSAPLPRSEAHSGVDGEETVGFTAVGSDAASEHGVSASGASSPAHAGGMGTSALTQEGSAYVDSYGDFVSPYRSSSEAGGRSGSFRAGKRSAGLDSLFSSTEDPRPTAQRSNASAGSAAFGASVAAASGAGVDEGMQPPSTDVGASARVPSWASPSMKREVHLLSPLSYEDMASVAAYVKADEVVVLSLGKAGDALGKRLLDFAFGVASALDARVKCVAPQTFLINRGADLSKEESARLSRLGIL